MRAGSSPSATQVQIGEIALTAVLDAVGLLGACNELYPDVPIERWDPYRTTYPELFSGDMWRLPVACTLLEANGRTLLVDAGVGPPGRWSWEGEREGMLPGGLASVGVAVDAVFFTHLHVDHIGWLADPSLFGDARILVPAGAVEYALENTSVEWLAGRLRELGDEGRIETVMAGDDLLPSARAVAYPGHYPGHLGVEIASVSSRALLIADAAPHPALLDECGWHFKYDYDAPLASETRAALVDSVVDTDTLVVCGHYPGGIGRVVRRDGRVLWEAV
jgi:glyoxylase-like metal-dependent hydrolase (beta-lactamase superfamily II)